MAYAMGKTVVEKPSKVVPLASPTRLGSVFCARRIQVDLSVHPRGAVAAATSCLEASITVVCSHVPDNKDALVRARHCGWTLCGICLPPRLEHSCIPMRTIYFSATNAGPKEPTGRIHPVRRWHNVAHTFLNWHTHTPVYPLRINAAWVGPSITYCRNHTENCGLSVQWFGLLSWLQAAVRLFYRYPVGSGKNEVALKRDFRHTPGRTQLFLLRLYSVARVKLGTECPFPPLPILPSGLLAMGAAGGRPCRSVAPSPSPCFRAH
ncbi:hypothetical protein An08g07680 [Aspergillus niger]|uniref:Uncharacterized protein n=2 Tax=Aspergillus niger TaxID=5061 RepID=A2QRY9_ASPNC|nr:hypothetical protein An08g07680 [Aspergillus niger]CAL00786.1 hypothetical protein An08g07680 [Aspergillus niger]